MEVALLVVLAYVCPEVPWAQRHQFFEYTWFALDFAFVHSAHGTREQPFMTIELISSSI